MTIAERCPICKGMLLVKFDDAPTRAYCGRCDSWRPLAEDERTTIERNLKVK
jgi:hypothetical protein